MISTLLGLRPLQPKMVNRFGVSIDGNKGSLPIPEYSRNMRLIGHSDQGGKPDGVRYGA